MRVTYKDHPDDLKTGQFLLDRGMEILEAAGAQDRWAFPVAENTSSGSTCWAPAAWATTRRVR